MERDGIAMSRLVYRLIWKILGVGFRGERNVGRLVRPEILLLWYRFMIVF